MPTKTLLSADESPKTSPQEVPKETPLTTPKETPLSRGEQNQGAPGGRDAMSTESASLKAEPAPTITRPSFQGDVVTVDDVVYEALGWDASTTPARFAYRRAPTVPPPPVAPTSEGDSLKPFFVAAESHDRQPDTVAAWRAERADTIRGLEQARAGIRALQRAHGPWLDARFQEINPEHPGYAAARGHLLGLGGSTAAHALEVCVKALGEIRAAFDTPALDALLHRVAEVDDHRRLPELDGLLDFGDAANVGGRPRGGRGQTNHARAGDALAGAARQAGSPARARHGRDRPPRFEPLPAPGRDDRPRRARLRSAGLKEARHD